MSSYISPDDFKRMFDQSFSNMTEELNEKKHDFTSNVNKLSRAAEVCMFGIQLYNNTHKKSKFPYIINKSVDKYTLYGADVPLRRCSGAILHSFKLT